MDAYKELRVRHSHQQNVTKEKEIGEISAQEPLEFVGLVRLQAVQLSYEKNHKLKT